MSSDHNLTLRELKKISKILLLVNAKIVEAEIEKIANTPIRKKMWVLIDGKRMPKDLAKEVNVTAMAVSKFLDATSIAGLIEYTQREPPQKILDYIPPAWLSFVMVDDTQQVLEKSAKQSNAGQPSNQNTIME